MDGFEVLVEVIPQLPQMVIVWIGLFLLFLILKTILYEPITKFLNDRKASIEADIENARELNEKADSLKKEYELRIADAREESQKILSEARGRGEELKNEMLEDAKREADSMKERARKDIDRERAAAFESVKSETGNMAVLIASKIMEEEMNVENQDKLVDRFIDQVGSTPWQN